MPQQVIVEKIYSLEAYFIIKQSFALTVGIESCVGFDMIHSSAEHSVHAICPWTHVLLRSASLCECLATYNYKSPSKTHIRSFDVRSMPLSPFTSALLQHGPPLILCLLVQDSYSLPACHSAFSGISPQSFQGRRRL